MFISKFSAWGRLGIKQFSTKMLMFLKHSFQKCFFFKFGPKHKFVWRKHDGTKLVSFNLMLFSVLVHLIFSKCLTSSLLNQMSRIQQLEYSSTKKPYKIQYFFLFTLMFFFLFYLN